MQKDINNNLKKLNVMSFLLGTLTLTPVITLFYLHRGMSYPEIFLLSMMFAFFTFLFEIPTGLIADKIGRKKSIILGLGFYIANSIILYHAYGFWQIAVGFLMFVIGFTFLSGIIEAMVYDSLKSIGKENMMKKVYGKYLSYGVLPSIFIPVIASIIASDLAEWQFRVLIGTHLFCQIVAFIISFTLKEPEFKFEKKKNAFALFKDGWHLFISNKNLRIIFFNHVLVFIPFMLFWRIWQPYLLDANQVGYELAVFVLGIIVSTHNAISFLLQRKIHFIEKKIGLEKTIFLTAFLPFIGYCLLIFTSNIYFAIIGVYLVFVLSVSRQPLISDYQNIHIQSENRATVLSLMNVIRGGFEMIFVGITTYLTIYNNYAGLYFALLLVLIGLVFFRIKQEHILKGGNYETC